MTEKVSIIIPTYQRSDKIERALKSAVNQTYKNIEIIVVDDNAKSPEERQKTATIVKKFKNVILIQNPKNLGGALSRNEGVNHATGKYITFLDDDDEYLPEKVSKQLEFMLKKNLDASFSNELIFDKNGKFKYKESHQKFDKNKPLKYHLTEKIIGPQTFMYKKSVFQAINGFDDAPSGQEYILMYKTIVNNYHIDYLDADLVKIYIHDGERISTGNKKIIGERKLYELKKQHFDILNFREKQKVKFEWAINQYRHQKRKKSPLQFYFFMSTLIKYPIQTTKTMLYKIKKEHDKKNFNNIL